VIYEISESDECSLDRFEGVHCGAYKKARMRVESQGRHQECLVYVDPVEREGKPNQEYTERLNKGISDSDLPPRYVDRYVRKFISDNSEKL